MSAVFSITTNPIQIFLGGQPTVSLVNEGPVTIYLGDNSSVSPSNGHAIPPTGQISWQPHRELWAVTSAGTARLTTSTAAVLSNTSRARYWSTLFSQNYSSVSAEPDTIGTIRLEVGHINTLNMTISGSIAGNIAQPIIGFLNWFTAEGDVILTENFEIMFHSEMGLPNKLTGIETYTTIPVRGAILEMVFTSTANTVFVDQVIISGSDVSKPFTTVCNNMITMATPHSATYSASSVAVENFAYSDTIHLPSLGNILQVTMTVVSASTGSGWIAIRDDVDAMYGFIGIPSGSQGPLTMTCRVPAELSMQCVGFLINPTGPPVLIAFKWSNEGI